MNVPEIAGKLAEHGILGMLSLLMGYAAWMKDRELTLERAARLADAKLYTDTLVKVQSEVIRSTDKISDLMEQLPRVKGPLR